jgi:hypothetical protein
LTDVRAEHLMCSISCCASLFEDPLGGVPLFSWLGLVFFQNGVDYAHPWPQFGPLHRLFPPVARRNRITQHLAHGHPRQPKLPCYRPLTSSLYQNRSPYTPVDLHLVHPSGVPRSRYLRQALRETKIRRSTFTPPHHAALAALCSLVLLRRSHLYPRSITAAFATPAA